MNTKAETQLALEQVEMRFRKLFSHSAFAALGATLVALGVVMTVPPANAAPSVCTDDCNFIQSAAQGGMTEVKLGELASTSGQRDDVKEFGHKMVKDHSSIDDNLKTLAAKKGVSLPDRLDTKHQEIVDKMAALSGSDFDNAYITCMIKDHKQDAKAFKSESSATKDTERQKLCRYYYSGGAGAFENRQRHEELAVLVSIMPLAANVTLRGSRRQAFLGTQSPVQYRHDHSDWVSNHPGRLRTQTAEASRLRFSGTLTGPQTFNSTECSRRSSTKGTVSAASSFPSRKS